MSDRNRDADLLPANATDFEIALSEATARIDALPAPADRQKRSATVDARFLSALAWEYSVNEWNSLWPDAKKRAVVEQSLAVHRVMGTAGALKRAIYALGYAGTVQEWFQYDGDPYKFRVLVNLNVESLSVPEMEGITRVALDTKNVRSFFEGFTFIRDVPGEVIVGAGLYSAIRATFAPLETIQPEWDAPAYASAGFGTRSFKPVFPVLS